MKTLIALLLALYIPAILLGDDVYLRQGIARTDRVWTGTDYRKFSNELKSGKVPLPRLTDEQGAKVLRRLCDVSNLAVLKDKQLSVEERLSIYIDIQEPVVELETAYRKSSTRGEKVGGEVSLVRGIQIHSYISGMELFEEFPPIPKEDPNYAALTGALRQVQSGLIDIFLEMYKSVAEDKRFTPDERSHLIDQIALTAQRYAQRLPPGTRYEMYLKYSALSQRASTTRDKTAFETIVDELQVKAQAGETVLGADISEVGIYAPRAADSPVEPSAAKAGTGGPDTFRLIQATTSVPARIGTRFGFRYKIRGAPSNEPIALMLLVEHPPYRDPQTGKTKTKDGHQLKPRIGEGFVSCRFEEEWELVPGKFRMEIWYKGRKLCEQAFMIVPDPKLGEGK